jgi:tRNA-splicing ligase RtcB (3'-phosphate/5'-hydroxy nucleic acid ligase)
MQKPITMITGHELKEAGYPEGKAIGEAMKIITGVYKNKPDAELMNILQKILRSPVDYINDPLLGDIAMALMPKPKMIDGIPQTDLISENKSYKKYGEDQIEEGAVTQMDIAMKLPVTVAGALMPDAHQGYGLPIGGVLATDNTVIPYGVGVDIGCRMCLSIYDIPSDDLKVNPNKYKRELIANTKFGAGQSWSGKQRAEHPVLEKPEFNATPLLRGLRQKAAEQLGTSGGGNHFVEWGEIEVFEDDPQLNLKAGKYLALLSHSGSRGFGATIAAHYTKLAKEHCKLPPEARNLAFLGLDSEEGQEYWLSMTLAGDYASACHEVIHQRLTNAIGGHLLARVENHHNFAWKEIHNGKEVIVHRKGATPAGKGVLGIIPGSMTAPGFLVRGKGDETSINSASHGAGRQMSRTAAIKNISRAEMKAILEEKGVMLIGAGLDEAPMAYKDINMVMAAQTDLVEVLAKFTPKIVRMADDGSRED